MNLLRNKWTIGLALLASSILATALGLFLLLGTAFGVTLVRHAILWAVQDRLNGQIRIERVAFGAQKHLALHGVSLQLADTLGGGEVAGAEEIAVNFNGWDALVGGAPLYSISIDGFRMAYIEDAGGSGMNTLDLVLQAPTNDPGEAARSSLDGAPFGLPFDLRDLRIRNGHFQYFDPADSTLVSARELAFRGAVLSPFKVEAAISAGQVDFDIGGYGDAVSNLKAVVYFEEDALTVHDLTMESAHGPPISYYATGEISTTGGYPATLDIAAHGHAGALLRIMGLESTMSGIFSMAGSLRNRLSDPSIETRFTSPAVRSEYGSFELATVEMKYAQQVLAIQRFRGKHEAGWFSGHGLLDFNRGSTAYRLQLESPEITLTKLPSAVVAGGTELAGEVDFTFEMEGNGFDDAPRRVDLNASSPLVHLEDIPLRDLNASARYRRGELAVDLREASFQLNSEGRFDTDGDMQLTGSIDVTDVGALPPPLDFERLRGSAKLDLYVLGGLERPTVRLAGWLSDVAYGEVPVGEMKIEAFLDERKRLAMNAVLDRLEFRATAHLAGDQAVSGYFNVHDLRLGNHFQDETGWGLDAVLRMEGSVAGTIAQPLLTGTGTVRNLVIRNEDLGDTDIDMMISKDQLEFTMTRIPGPTVLAEGSIELAEHYPYDLRVDLLHTSLSPLLSILSKRPIEDSTGWFSGNVHAVGLAGYPDLSTITVALDSLGILMGDRELHFAAPSTVKLENQVITVDDFRLTGDFGRVTVNGTASLAADGRVDLETLLDNVQLEFISPFLVSDGFFRGAMDGAISLGGTPAAPTVNSLLTVSDVHYEIENRTSLLGTVTASVFYENQLLRIPVLSVQSPLGLSEIDLAYPLDLSWASVDQAEANPSDRYTASMVVENLAVAPMREFLKMIPADLDGYVRGRIDLDGSVRNSLDLTGVVALDSLKLFGLQNEFVNTRSIRARFDAGHIEIEPLSATIRHRNHSDDERGSLTMQGRLAYGNDGAGTLESDFTILGEAIRMDALMALANLDLPMGGRVNTRISISGPASAQVIDTRVFMDQPTYNEVSVDSVTAHMVYNGGEVDIRDLRIRENDDLITMHGTVFFDPGQADRTVDLQDMALTVEGNDIDLSFLSGVVYDLESIEGNADFRLSFGRLPSATGALGRLSVRGAGLRIRDIEPMFQADALQLDVDGETLTLQPVIFRAGEGTIRLAGDMVVTTDLSLAEIETHADFNQAEVELVGSAMLKVDGSLAWTGNRDRSRIYHVTDPLVVGGVITHPLNVGELLLDNAIIRPQDAPDPFLESIALDVAVDMPDLAIENNIAQLALEGGVAFGNTAQNPLVLGNAIAREEGAVRYLGTTFELDAGRIDLTRRVPLENFTALLEYPVEQLDPTLSIQARARHVRDIYGTDYEVELRASGPVSTVTPQLRAFPVEDNGPSVLSPGPLQGPEVISLLTLGMAELTTLGTPDAMAGMGQRAILMATGATAERMLNLDEVQIEGDLFAGSDSRTGSPAQLTLSKRINRRARVSYTRLFESSEYTFRVGYQLTDYLFIETFAEQLGEHPQNGIDLRVKFRFR